MCTVPGHLFIVRGDLLLLACDAILVPSGSENGRPGFVTEHWQAELRSELRDGFLHEAPDAARRVIPIRAGKTIRDPGVWAGFTGDAGNESVDWYAAAASEFVRLAAAEARGTTDSSLRPLDSSNPLLALPLVGSGEGGMQADKGSLVEAIVLALVRSAERYDADVALVLRTPEAYAAAQQARARVAGDTTWCEIEEHREHAVRLARLARTERLVLFLGAGASIGAGLPSWSDLIKRLGVSAGLSDAERGQLEKLQPLDAGHVLEDRLISSGRSLMSEVIGLTDASRPSLIHQLAASMPAREAVTTNYDKLFEVAWRSAGRDPKVLPWDSVAGAQCWLLKLHGSVDEPQSPIVLSRDDYLRFEDRGVALAGIVQAMLLTRHMLFVGYSLSDPNFHRLMHQVRTAIGPADQRPEEHFGTALTPRDLGLSEGLWKGDVEFVSTAGADGDNPRRLAILLDMIGALASAPVAHLLDGSYAALFSEVETRLGERLSGIWDLLADPDLPEAVRWSVEDALTRIGRPAQHQQRASIRDR
jgi:SIR2-like domain